MCILYPAVGTNYLSLLPQCMTTSQTLHIDTLCVSFLPTASHLLVMLSCITQGPVLGCGSHPVGTQFAASLMLFSKASFFGCLASSPVPVASSVLHRVLWVDEGTKEKHKWLATSRSCRYTRHANEVQQSRFKDRSTAVLQLWYS